MFNKKGFTLIELLIVIVIIGILSVAVVPRVLDYPKKARDANRKQSLMALQTSMNLYLQDGPKDFTVNSRACVDSSPTLQTKLKLNISDLPKDPQSSPPKIGVNECKNYFYIIEADATNGVTAFAFVAPMEVSSNGNTDQDVTNGGITVDTLTSAATGKYYYVKQKL